MGLRDAIKSESRAATRKAAWKSWPPEVIKETKALIDDILAGKEPRYSTMAIRRGIKKHFDFTIGNTPFHTFLRDNYGDESWDSVIGDGKKKK